MLNLKIENIFLEKVDSTQLYAKKNYAHFSPSQITCIFAEMQTKGIGRFHRSWISSPHENILATFYFNLPSSTKDIATIGQILALSAAKVLQSYGLNPEIKWPNDLLVQEKKICGILCQTIFEKETVHIFLGLGLNINMGEKDFLLIDQKATSLKEEIKRTLDPKKILDELEKVFLNDLSLFLKKGFLAFHEKFEKILAYKNRTISLFDGENHYKGTIDSINSLGQLIFKLLDGSKKLFSSGDITL